MFRNCHKNAISSERSVWKRFQIFYTSLYVAVGNFETLLFFNEPMKKMTSLARLFLTRRSSVSLKNLFSAVRLAFNVFRFGLRIQWMTLHVFL